MRFLIALLFLALPAAALAQQPPDPALMQKAIGALQAQRNAAWDAAASAQAQAQVLADKNAALEKEITELKKPKETKEPAKK